MMGSRAGAVWCGMRWGQRSDGASMGAGCAGHSAANALQGQARGRPDAGARPAISTHSPRHHSAPWLNCLRLREIEYAGYDGQGYAGTIELPLLGEVRV
eukprot:3099108-Rhodomonas_salina.1